MVALWAKSGGITGRSLFEVFAILTKARYLK
jgi:hypothetical protein